MLHSKRALFLSLLFVLAIAALLSGCGANVATGPGNTGEFDQSPDISIDVKETGGDVTISVNQDTAAVNGDACPSCGTAEMPVTMPEETIPSALTGACLGIGDLRGAGQWAQWETVVARCDPRDCISDVVNTWAEAATFLKGKGWTDSDKIHVFHVDGVLVDPTRQGEAAALVGDLGFLPGPTGMLCTWDANLFVDWTPSSSSTTPVGSSSRQVVPTAVPQGGTWEAMVVAVGRTSTDIPCGENCMRVDNLASGTAARDALWADLQQAKWGRMHVIHSDLRVSDKAPGEGCVYIRDLPAVPGDSYIVVSWGCKEDPPAAPFWAP